MGSGLQGRSAVNAPLFAAAAPVPLPAPSVNPPAARAEPNPAGQGRARAGWRARGTSAARRDLTAQLRGRGSSSVARTLHLLLSSLVFSADEDFRLLPFGGLGRGSPSRETALKLLRVCVCVCVCVVFAGADPASRLALGVCTALAACTEPAAAGLARLPAHPWMTLPDRAPGLR